MTKQAITIIGSGYVGLTSAAVFANSGYSVVCLDVDKRKVDAINQGSSFFYEHGIDELLRLAIKSGNLKATLSYKEAIPEADFIFSCVGTPDNPDGSSNLEYVFSAAETAAPLLKDGAIFIQKSTVPVGTGKKADEILQNNKPANTEVAYVSNPEFLRESTAIYDFLNADRVVVGTDDNSQAADGVLGLYRQVEQNKTTVAKTAKVKLNPEIKTAYITGSIESAELIKVTANAFLALKISFANSIAKLADHTGADVTEVMDAVGADARIGRAFLNAGRGYGGGCFPKDVSGLINSAFEHGVDLQIMTAATDVNESMPGYIANKIKEKTGKLDSIRCGVLGLAFKPNTSDARRSPAVTLANILAHDGAKVSAYDPQAMEEAGPDLRKDVTLKASIAEVIRDTDVIVVATDWPEFKNLDLKSHRGKILVDCMNVFDKAKVKSQGLSYIGVGR